MKHPLSITETKIMLRRTSVSGIKARFIIFDVVYGEINAGKTPKAYRTL
jgi:hypothetical protein